MAVDYNLYLSGVTDRQLVDTLYQSYLSTYNLSEEEARSLCPFVAEFDDEDEVAKWDELVEETWGFRPNLNIEFNPSKKHFGQASMHMLRFIGFLLNATSGDGVLYSLSESPMLVRQQGELTLLALETAWNQTLIDALKEGMGAVEAV